jgi:hypothetical protein
MRLILAFILVSTVRGSSCDIGLGVGMIGMVVFSILCLCIGVVGFTSLIVGILKGRRR